MSFAKLCEEFIRLKKDENLSDTTVENYEYNIKKYILPKMPKNIMMSQLRYFMLKILYGQSKGHGQNNLFILYLTEFLTQPNESSL